MHAYREHLLPAFDPGSPLQALGHDYPRDAMLLLGALWGFLLGLGLILPPASPEGQPGGGKIALAMLLNALLLVSSLFVAYIGGKLGDPANMPTVALFGIIALVQGALGVILLILAIFEKPKGIVPLMLGVPVYLFGVGIALFTLLKLGGGA
jgi:hypothetical protein